MPTSVQFDPHSLNFGGVPPGSQGPNITLDPSFPIDALSSAGGIGIKAPVAANVTATVIGDTSHFSVRDVFVRHFVMRDVDPNELPHGHHGPLPKERVLEIVSNGDGSLPLRVEAGQFLLIRVQYAALAKAGSFAGTLVIQGDTWNTIRIPLSLFLGEVTTTISTALLTIVQGRQAELPITLKSVVGPETDVRYELSTLKLHTGISLTPATFHVKQGKSLAALGIESQS